MSENTTAGAGAQAPIRFEYTGRAGKLAPIVIVNALLNIVTLMFYRFWARTRVRRFLWSTTSLAGEPLEYTGTGKELFLGFLIVVFVIFLPLYGVNTAATFYWGQADPLTVGVSILTFVVIYFLIGVAIFRARRYRLSRTLWRGIRGGLVGSSNAYGLRFLGFMLLFPLTLGWSYPWQIVALSRRELSGTTFGDRQFSFEGGPGPLFKPFAVLWLGYIGGYAAFIYAFATLWQASNAGIDSPEAAQAFLEGDAVIWSIRFFILLGLWMMLMKAWFQTRRNAYIARCTRFEGLSFGFPATTMDYIRLSAGNAAIYILTLSFGAPFTQMRTFRFFCRHLVIEGDVDFDAIAQSTLDKDRTGEGLADAFDLGAV